MQYQLSRSARRRTIGITIKQGEVRVFAPTQVDDDTIRAFVSSKQSWIQRHLVAQRGHLDNLPTRRWQHGEYVYWLGQKMQIQVRPGQRNTIEAIDKTLHIRLSRRVKSSPAAIKKLITGWFHSSGQRWLEDTLMTLPAAQDLPPRDFRVANYTAKWGACDGQGRLSFSWRLFAAPAWVVRYVVLHELCHLRVFNHSPQYWDLVASYDPNYRAAEAWLKTHGHSLLNDKYFNYVNPPLSAGK